MFVCRVATLQIASLKMVPTASTEPQASRCYSINSSQHNINSAESVDLSLYMTALNARRVCSSPLALKASPWVSLELTTLSTKAVTRPSVEGAGVGVGGVRRSLRFNSPGVRSQPTAGVGSWGSEIRPTPPELGVGRAFNTRVTPKTTQQRCHSAHIRAMPS